MKQLTTLLIALGLSSVCAMSQTVTVYLKDNTAHKFNAEYLEEIKFKEVAPTPDQIQFDSIDLNIFSNGNVTLTMTNEADNVKCVADLYGTTEATFLEEGTYEVSNENTPFSVSPLYSSVSVDGESSKPASGKVTVALETLDILGSQARVVGENIRYVINTDFQLENGKSFSGVYIGKLPSYNPWIIDQLSKAQYNINPQPKGQFYVKFFDAAWKYDIAMIFMAEENDNRLPAGTYTLNDFATPGSLLSGSYVEGYSPNFNCKLRDGSKVVVEDNNGEYNIVMYLNLSDGRNAEFTFEGEISGEPLFDEPSQEAEVFKSCYAQAFGMGNTTINLYNTEVMADYTKMLSLDCYGSSNATYFEPGVYKLGGSEIPYVDLNPSYTFFAENDAEPVGFKSGELNVKLNGVIYTLEFNGVLDDEASTPINAVYEGKIAEFGPELSLELSAASYSTNPRPAGNFYVKFNDTNWTCEMALDMFADSNATTLPAGTYTYSTENTPGTFGSNSYVDLFNPNSNNRMAEGSSVVVTVDENGVYHFDMDLIFVDGRIADFKYEGTISGTPQFDTPDNGVEYPELIVEYYGFGNATLLFYSEDNENVISLDSYCTDGAPFLETGVYKIGTRPVPYIDTNISFTYYCQNYKDENAKVLTGLKSGTLTVTREGAVYTFVLDAILNDEAETPLKMWHTGKLNTFGPEMDIELSAASYSTNPRPAGNFYVKFNDKDWSCEMALDMFADSNATTLPAGTYTFSTENTPGTFGSNSYVDLFNPNSNNRMAEGSSVEVTVDENGVYHFDMDLIFVDGRIAKMNYEGSISNKPVFE